MTGKLGIVFVCEHGAAKSIIAAAYFHEMALEKGLGVRAMARGIHPDREYSPKAVAGLREEGLAPMETTPQKLSLPGVEAAQRIVAFCELPDAYENKAVIEPWEDIPPVSESYEAARAAIVEKIERLLSHMAEEYSKQASGRAPTPTIGGFYEMDHPFSRPCGSRRVSMAHYPICG